MDVYGGEQYESVIMYTNGNQFINPETGEAVEVIFKYDEDGNTVMHTKQPVKHKPDEWRVDEEQKVRVEVILPDADTENYYQQFVSCGESSGEHIANPQQTVHQVVSADNLLHVTSADTVHSNCDSNVIQSDNISNLNQGVDRGSIIHMNNSEEHTITAPSCDHLVKGSDSDSSTSDESGHKSAEETSDNRSVKHKQDEQVCSDESSSPNKNLKLTPHSKLSGSGLQCAVCLSTFLTKNKLEIHKREENHATKPSTCDMCGKTYLQHRHLQFHGLMSKNGKKLYACKKCVQVYKQLTSKKSKPEVTVSGSTCSSCSKSIPADVTHCDSCKSGEKDKERYTCEICWEGFSRETSLKRHKVVVHWRRD